MEKSIASIKKELRFIKNKQRILEEYINLEAHYKERLEWLNTKKPTDRVLKDIDGVNRLLEKVSVVPNLRKLQELEKIYLEKINLLENEYDKLVLIKIYLKGYKFSTVSEELHYSIDGIKKRARNALLRLKAVFERE